MKRVFGPILLTIVALLSIAGVFLVQHIEQSGGPIGEPVVSSRFSPNDDGDLDQAVLNLNVQPAAHITVHVLDEHGREVTRMADKRLLEGDTQLTWDGTRSDGRPAPDGHYHLRITTSSSRRTFEPEHDVVLDRTPPLADPLLLTHISGTTSPCLWEGTLIRESGSGLRIEQSGRIKPVTPKLIGSPKVVSTSNGVRMVAQRLQLPLRCAPPRPNKPYTAVQPVTVQIADQAHNITLVNVTFASGDSA